MVKTTLIYSTLFSMCQYLELENCIMKFGQAVHNFFIFRRFFLYISLRNIYEIGLLPHVEQTTFTANHHRRKQNYDSPDGQCFWSCPEAFLPASGDRASVFLQPCHTIILIPLCVCVCSHTSSSSVCALTSLFSFSV